MKGGQKGLKCVAPSFQPNSLLFSTFCLSPPQSLSSSALFSPPLPSSSLLFLITRSPPFFLLQSVSFAPASGSPGRRVERRQRSGKFSRLSPNTASPSSLSQLAAFFSLWRREGGKSLLLPSSLVPQRRRRRPRLSARRRNRHLLRIRTGVRRRLRKCLKAFVESRAWLLW